MAKNPVKTSPKSEAITVRLSPKLKYGLELLARKQYRTVSSVVEWIVNSAINEEFPRGAGIEELWDTEEADKFVKLGLHHENLFTFDEQILWKLIRENGYFWKGEYDDNEWTWEVNQDSALWDRIRDHWNLLIQVAEGNADKSQLPGWAKTQIRQAFA